MSITVFPDLSVRVIAPAHISSQKIQEKLEKRKSWIVKQQRFFSDLMPCPSPRKYISGETYQYMGKHYRLRVRETDKGKEKVVLKHGFIYVFLPNTKDTKTVKRLLNHWYFEHAEKKFSERLFKQFEKFKKYHLEPPILRIRAMKTRWGSCSTKGNITLNLRLIQAPSHCMDYVIVHELCHLIEHNHSPKYYKLLDRMMPDWKERKKRLERI